MSLKKLLKSAVDGELLVSTRYQRFLETRHDLLFDEEVAEFIKQALITPGRDRRLTFSASARGACPRAQVFQFTSLKPVERFNADTILVFHQGTFIHLKWQAMLLMAGILDQVEVPFVDDRLRLSGTVDGCGTIPTGHPLRGDDETFGWELKSVNEHGYRYVLNNGPRPAHLLQIHAYMLLSGWNIWSLVYENKTNQDWKEYIVRYDERIADEVLLELQYLNECVDNRVLPPVLDECRKRQGAFKVCPFAHVCLDTTEWPERKIRV